MRALFVAGGQAYHGPTQERDIMVTTYTAFKLFELIGDTIQVVTGGMPGIPDDFARAWQQAGGTHVLCVVSSEQETAFLERSQFPYIVVGETQAKRRVAVTQLPNLKCAFVVQGGKYTTDELRLLSQRGDVPIISYWGSGGAAGGKIPWDDDWVFDKKPDNPLICSDDPNEDPERVAIALASQITAQFLQ